MGTINPYSGEKWPSDIKNRSDRYSLGYAVGKEYGLKYHAYMDNDPDKPNALVNRSEEFQMGFWDAIGDLHS